MKSQTGGKSKKWDYRNYKHQRLEEELTMVWSKNVEMWQVQWVCAESAGQRRVGSQWGGSQKCYRPQEIGVLWPIGHNPPRHLQVTAKFQVSVHASIKQLGWDPTAVRVKSFMWGVVHLFPSVGSLGGSCFWCVGPGWLPASPPAPGYSLPLAGRGQKLQEHGWGSSWV